MSTLGKAVIELSADTARFTGDIGRAAAMFGKQMDAMERAAKLVAGVTVGISAAAAAMAKSAINDMDAIGKLAQRVGVSTEALSGLKYAASLSDVQMDTLATSLRKLSVNMLDTKAGTGEARDAFRALGLSVTAADGTLKNADVMLGEVADRFAKMQDGAGKTALAVKVFGKSGADLIPMLNDGAAGLERMRMEADRFGLTVSQSAAKAAQDFNDNIERLKKSIPALGIQLANVAVGPLADFTAKMVDASNAAGGFWKFLADPFAGGISNPGATIVELEGKLAKLKTTRDELSKPTFANSLNDVVFGDVGDLNRQIAVVERRLEFLRKMQAATFERLSVDSIHRGPKSAAPGLPIAGASSRGGDLVGNQWAEDMEEWNKKMAEAAAATVKYNQAVKERAYWENMAVPGVNSKEQLATYLEGLDSLRAIREAQMRAVAGFDEMGNAVAKVEKAGIDFGFTFNSQLENLIVKGGKLSDVVGALGEDIARMITRAAITDPLGKAIGGLVAPIGKSIGGFLGGLIPSYDTGTPYVPRDTLAMVHKGEAIIPASQNHGGRGDVHVHLNVGSLDPRTAAHVILANMPVIKGELRKAAKWRGDV